jgi:hypothetical protein
MSGGQGFRRKATAHCKIKNGWARLLCDVRNDFEVAL